ncbi:caffeoyl-CoA O-methyltransferase-like isoform X1 [Musa acuminata AAA Group]|uniref:caffeoyl-CoA O-methyltransferase-like isoform X1 n=1 Tax=Musa acuminata AAA Group TaxID=214697 RepID=UPI0031D9DEFC
MGKTAYHFISPICTQLESLADGHQLQCIPLYDPTASPPQTSIVGTLLTLAKKLRERERVMSSSESESSQQGRHQEVGHKSLLQSDALYQYMLETTVYPREPEYMKELREITAKHPWNIMTTSADEGQFLNMLLKLINAKNTMEIGVYTGYSLLATALALPDDGKILAMDINRENYELGLPVIEKAGVAHKIDFREGPALPVLDLLLEDVRIECIFQPLLLVSADKCCRCGWSQEKKQGSFDFVFVDADKDNYLNYHKRLLELVKVGGVIAYDNTLWNGSVVAPPDAPLRKYVRYYRDFVLHLNRALAADPRIEICQLPVGDGVTLCRRIK